MGHGEAHILPQPLAQPSGGGLDVLHPVVQVVDLPAPVQLPPDGLRHGGPFVLHDVGLHRLAVPGGLLDGGHIPDARQGHVQRPGNGGGGQGQGVHLTHPLPELLLVGHAEALLLVDDEQPQILEHQILRQQAMGADEQVDLSLRRPLQNVLGLLGGAEPAQHLHRHREGAEAVHGGGIVLLGQHRGGYQNGGLLAVQNALHHRPQGHLRLAVAHIAAQQPVHGYGLFHIRLDLPDGL